LNDQTLPEVLLSAKPEAPVVLLVESDWDVVTVGEVSSTVAVLWVLVIELDVVIFPSENPRPIEVLAVSSSMNSVSNKIYVITVFPSGYVSTKRLKALKNMQYFCTAKCNFCQLVDN
jgi:hypothetical protein